MTYYYTILCRVAGVSNAFARGRSRLHSIPLRYATAPGSIPFRYATLPLAAPFHSARYAAARGSIPFRSLRCRSRLHSIPLATLPLAAPFHSASNVYIYILYSPASRVYHYYLTSPETTNLPEFVREYETYAPSSIK
jgi:hypothetical protein